MKTDRELLELAAKAAGIKVARFLGNNAEVHDGALYLWNPLEDDGDAFRLAVKLQMSIEVEFDRVEVFHLGGCMATEFIYEQPPTDLGAATRRAIVCAAAAIGEAMP